MYSEFYEFSKSVKQRLTKKKLLQIARYQNFLLSTNFFSKQHIINHYFTNSPPSKPHDWSIYINSIDTGGGLPGLSLNAARNGRRLGHCHYQWQLVTGANYSLF